MTKMFALNLFNRGHERLRNARAIFDNHVNNQNAFYEECNESIRLSLMSMLVEEGAIDVHQTSLVQLTRLAIKKMGAFEQLRDRLETLEESDRLVSLTMKISPTHDSRPFMQTYLADVVEVNEIANDYLSVYQPTLHLNPSTENGQKDNS